MASLVTFAKALADPTRVRVVRCLLGGPLCVCELADVLEVGMSTLSTHLQLLRGASVVVADRRSKWVSYAMEPKTEGAVRRLLEVFQGVEPRTVRERRDHHRLHRRLALRVDGCCVRGVGELENHIQEITMSNGTCECTCGCGCQKGEPCTCGDCCNCGCNKSDEATCKCQAGGECTCGPDCKCKK